MSLKINKINLKNQLALAELFQQIRQRRDGKPREAFLSPRTPKRAEPEGREEAGERMATVTCNSCNAGFDTDEQQRLHYRSEWHRYNLKRKVSSSRQHLPCTLIRARGVRVHRFVRWMLQSIYHMMSCDDSWVKFSL
jgi:hypothetical protein